MSSSRRRTIVNAVFAILTLIVILGACGFAIYFIHVLYTALCAAIECVD